jgi:hypothetical protein
MLGGTSLTLVPLRCLRGGDASPIARIPLLPGARATLSAGKGSHELNSSRPVRDYTCPKKEDPMFLILAVVLVVLWLGGFTLFHVTGFLIHLLLIFAVISLIMHFIGGGRRAV